MSDHPRPMSHVPRCHAEALTALIDEDFCADPPEVVDEQDFNVIVYDSSDLTNGIGSVMQELCDAERALDDIAAEVVSIEVVERMLHRIHAAAEQEGC